MKDNFKEIVKNSIKQHYFNLFQENNSLIFELQNVFLPFSKKFIIIKHRKTGKRISKKLINSKTELTLEDIREFSEIGYFDIFLYVKIFGRFFKKRSSFNYKNNDNKFIFDNENKLLFLSYSTNGSNLSFNLKDSLFKPEIYDIVDEDDEIIINGRIKLFKDIAFDKIELLSKSNKVGRKVSNCSYNNENDIITFSGVIDKDISDKDINSNWDIDIRLISEDLIISSEKLNCDDWIKHALNNDIIFGKYETKYEDEKFLIIFYPSKNRKLKFKIVSSNQYSKSSNKSKGNKLYNKFKKIGLKDDLVFFESFHGKYNNNPKYLYEKMLEMGLDKRFKFIWAYDGEDNLPGNPIVVKSNSEDYYKYLSQSKYRVNNATFPIIDNNSKIIYVQTWHGTPLKRLSRDINVQTGIGWSHFNKEVKTWNYLVSANEYSSNIFKRAFEYRKEILEVGYPANDIFYMDESKKQEIRNKFDIPSDKKIILYAPTFRDDKKDEEGNRVFDLELDLEKLRSALSDEYIVIIKTHYVISKKLEISGQLKDFVIDFSNYDDIHELFILSDVLITDYSSSFFDFAHTKNPILFFMPDLKSYMQTRGLYGKTLLELPGPILINTDEVIDALLDLDKFAQDYKEKYDTFYDKFCSIGNGDSSEKIIKHVWGD